jgi:hypothetical protein
MVGFPVPRERRKEKHGVGFVRLNWNDQAGSESVKNWIITKPARRRIRERLSRDDAARTPTRSPRVSGKPRGREELRTFRVTMPTGNNPELAVGRDLIDGGNIGEAGHKRVHGRNRGASAIPRGGHAKSDRCQQCRYGASGRQRAIHPYALRVLQRMPPKRRDLLRRRFDELQL